MFNGSGRVRPGDSTDSLRLTGSFRAPPGGASTICLSDRQTPLPQHVPRVPPPACQPNNIFGSAPEVQYSPRASPRAGQSSNIISHSLDFGQPSGPHAAPGQRHNTFGESLDPCHSPRQVPPAGQSHDIFGESVEAPAPCRKIPLKNLSSNIFEKNTDPTPSPATTARRTRNSIFENAPAAEDSTRVSQQVGKVTKLNRRKAPGDAAASSAATIHQVIETENYHCPSAPSGKVEISPTQVSRCIHNDTASTVGDSDYSLHTAANASWMDPVIKVSGRLRGDHAQHKNKCSPASQSRRPTVLSRGCTDWRGPLIKLNSSDSVDQTHPHIKSAVNIGDRPVDTKRVAVISAGCKDLKSPVLKLSTRPHTQRQQVTTSTVYLGDAPVEDTQYTAVTSVMGKDWTKPTSKLNHCKGPNRQLESTVCFGNSIGMDGHTDVVPNNVLYTARKNQNSCPMGTPIVSAACNDWKKPALHLGGFAPPPRRSVTSAGFQRSSSMDIRPSVPATPMLQESANPPGDGANGAYRNGRTGGSMQRARSNFVQRNPAVDSMKYEPTGSTTTSTRHEDTSMRPCSPRRSLRGGRLKS